MFAGLAAFFSFSALFLFVEHLSIAELWLLALATFLLVRYLAHALFHRMSYHRGIYHSLLAAAFFSCLTAVAYSRALGRHEGVAWLAAGFMLVGYLVHLTLDEICSVDVMDTRIKSSFGTALKPIDFKHPGHTAAMAVATVIAFLMAPPVKSFVEGVSSQELWAGLHQRLLPKGGWFRNLGEIGRHANKPLPRPAGVDEDLPASAPTEPSPPITTGSIPGPAAPAPGAAER